MTNPYMPVPMRVEKSAVETADGSIRTLTLSFARGEDGKAFSFLPGQFAELSLLGTGEAPFGIASSPEDSNLLDFTVSRVGLVTTELHNLKPGDTVGMRGPFGDGYPLEHLREKSILIVGGGFGFSTLRSFTGYALNPDIRRLYKDITVVYGARNPGLLLYRADLLEWEKRTDLRLEVTVDEADGEWTGRTGVVPAVVAGLDIDPRTTIALVCGPPGMIRFTLPALSELGLSPARVYLSLEMKMKCGIGKCGRCNIGGAYVCTDGPVFSLAELNKLPQEYSK